MIEIYRKYRKGERFKELSDINLRDLAVKQPADLVGSSMIMQQMAKKYAKSLRNQ
ncbi:hypothetical protein [Peribacillus saganii]|uniref:hypothetical protein n=1 Tax=Peribacillus saganii TaxID=2303992 RepID=UPI0013140AB7|nr:hypothetical protein [Peribacillus saganii]